MSSVTSEKSMLTRWLRDEAELKLRSGEWGVGPQRVFFWGGGGFAANLLVCADTPRDVTTTGITVNVVVKTEQGIRIQCDPKSPRPRVYCT